MLSGVVTLSSFLSHFSMGKKLTLKEPIRTAAENIHKYFFIFFSEKIRLDISCESSARQRIHMKLQALFSLKIKVKKLKCHLLQFLFGVLRVRKRSKFFLLKVDLFLERFYCPTKQTRNQIFFLRKKKKWKIWWCTHSALLQTSEESTLKCITIDVAVSYLTTSHNKEQSIAN